MDLTQRIMRKVLKGALGLKRDPVYAARVIRMLTARRENLEHFIRHGVSVVGNVDLKIWRPDGSLKIADCFPNLVVTVGLQHIADQMSDQGNAAMTHMAVGTGTTAAAAGQTALVTELDRNALDSTTPSGAGVIYVCTWAAGDGTGALTEAGIFNQASGGVLLCRTVYSVKNKGAGDSMTLTWTVTFS